MLKPSMKLYRKTVLLSVRNNEGAFRENLINISQKRLRNYFIDWFIVEQNKMYLPLNVHVM